MKKQAKNLISTGILILIVSLLALSSFFVLAGSFNPEDEREIGYEFLDDNKVVHIWNTQDDYFFEKDAGIQLTNHYEDYWTRNIFCIGYYSGEEWIKIKCADELTNFEKSIETDDETYVNATLWKDFTYNNYELRLGVQYHLGLDDKTLSITIYGKNIGVDIPFDLGFAWKVTDVEIATDEKDSISLNDTEYPLDGTYDLLFKNMTTSHFDEETNETIIKATPRLRIHDRLDFLAIDWNENLKYAVKMYSDGNQENFYVALLINAGHFNPQQEKSTTFQWIDADYTPVPVGTFTSFTGNTSMSFGTCVFVSGDYAYTTSGSDDNLAVWNISLHGNPVFLGNYTSSTGDYSLDSAYSVFVSGDYAYTVSYTDDNFVVWNISAHGDPVPLGFYSANSGNASLDGAQGVFVLGDYAYTISGNDDNLAVWDISGHGNPVFLGNYTDSDGDYSLDLVRGLFVLGDYAYTVSWGDDTLSVFDISGHADPVPVGTYTDNETDYSLDEAWSVFVLGDYAYTLGGDIGLNGTLAVFNISGHGDPVPVGSYSDSDGDYSLEQGTSVFVSGDYAYTLSGWDDTLSVFDISAHGDPVPVGSYGPDSEGDYSLDYAWSVVVSDGYAYTLSYQDSTFTVFDIETTPPLVTITSPTNSTYNTTTINFNVTATDTISGMDSCLYSFDSGVKNYTMSNTTASSFNATNSSMTQGSHTVTFYCNDTDDNINGTETETFFIDSIKPNISLDSPINHQNISSGTDVYFNFTATDAGELDTCQLWHNATGTWHKNYSWVGPTSDAQNYTTVNVSEGRFKYNVWCNDTLDNFNWSASNYTFTIDSTSPNVNITTENDTVISEAQSITVEYNISDTYLKQCYFSLRTSGGLIHNYPENTSLSCTSTSRTISTLVFGTFILQMWGEDYSGNLDHENLTFTTYFGGPGGGGGGGTSVIFEEEEEEEVVEKTFCGDGVCDELNDYGIRENWYTCPSDCPSFNLDEFVFSFSKYCFDNDTATICAWTQLFAAAPLEGINVTVAVCGDGVCEPSENPLTCPSDCGKFSLKSFTGCLDVDPDTYCFFQSNLSYILLFFGGTGILLISVAKIKFPGEKKKMSSYGYVVKRWGRKKRK